MPLHADDGRARDRGGSPFACESGCARRRERHAVGARPIRQRRRRRGWRLLRQASDSQVRLQVTARIGLPASTPPCPAATESRVAAASVAAPGRSTAWGCAPLAMTRERLRLAPLPCLSDAQASVALLDMA
jgi:hypothetical protein